MGAHHRRDQIGLIAGGVAIVVMGVLTACGPAATESPSATTTPDSSSVTLTPAEKGAPGSFSPTALNPLPSMVPTACVGAPGNGCAG
ncbi:MAG TPA: hypothetical protein DEP24_02990 [Mycobacterium sp.]|nr:hypothetical protein [Mycobacterium sp.]